MKRKKLYSNILENKKFYSNKTLGDTMKTFKEDNLYYVKMKSGFNPEDYCTSSELIQNFEDLGLTGEASIRQLISTFADKGINVTLGDYYAEEYRFKLDTTWDDLVNHPIFDYDLFCEVLILDGYLLNNSLETLGM